MPCRSDGFDNVPSQNERELDKVTRLLCEVLTTLSRSRKKALLYLLQYNPELDRWWIEHQEADRKRLSRERQEKENRQIKKKAISKLTSKERKLLGL